MQEFNWNTHKFYKNNYNLFKKNGFKCIICDKQPKTKIYCNKCYSKLLKNGLEIKTPTYQTVRYHTIQYYMPLHYQFYKSYPHQKLRGEATKRKRLKIRLKWKRRKERKKLAQKEEK